MKGLTYLDLRNNGLTTLPDWFGELTALTELNLALNRLTTLPNSLDRLTSLTELDLFANRLTALPDCLGELTALTQLNLSGNELAVLPDCLGELTALRQLDLRNNGLTALPDWVGELTALIRLDLAHNRLTTLPFQLADLVERGLDLDLDKNPLVDPLASLIARGPDALVAYLRSLHDGHPQYETKLLLVGEGNVGKSSLVAALKSEPFVEGRPTTHGIEISALSSRHPSLEEDMTVRAWDFGGQEVYRVSHQFFFTRRALYAVVWHARNGREQDEVEGWLRRIRLRVGHDARVLLVATHCAERRAELDYAHLEQMFPGLLAGFFEVDSRTGQGIPELRQAISEEAARLPQMGELISNRWVAARDDILARSDSEPQILYELFAEVCGQHGLSESEASALAKLMHDLGQVVYYAEDAGLSDIVVLNPEWLTKAISYVLEDESTRDGGGILDHARVQDIWSNRVDGFAPRYHRYFLRLMEKFDISYRFEDEGTRSLVAQLVPFEHPPLPWNPGIQPGAGIRSLTLVCRLAEPAPGLIPWLTVRHHRDSTGAHWRRGVFLRHRIAAYKSEALLELLSDTELAAQVRAPSPDMYFNVLRDSIEDLITSRWPGLDYWLDIPCPGLAADGTSCPGRFPLDGLLRHREKGRSTVTCMRCDEVPEISALLTGFTAPPVPLATELEQVHIQLADISAGMASVQEQAAQIAGTVRRVHRIVSTEVTDCPRLFTLVPARPTGASRIRVQQRHYRLTLWCEQPGDEHPWEAAAYDLDVPREWFIRIAPYARLACRTLQLVVPLAGAIATAAVPAVQQTSAQADLEVMTTLVAELPVPADQQADEDPEKLRGQLTAAQGEALRAIRAIIFEHDRLRAFGGMRRVQTPAGDLLWVCPNHYPEYDPGLPRVWDYDQPVILRHDSHEPSYPFSGATAEDPQAAYFAAGYGEGYDAPKGNASESSKFYNGYGYNLRGITGTGDVPSYDQSSYAASWDYSQPLRYDRDYDDNWSPDEYFSPQDKAPRSS